MWNVKDSGTTLSQAANKDKKHKGLKLNHEAHNVYSTVKKYTGNITHTQKMQRHKAQQTDRRTNQTKPNQYHVKSYGSCQEHANYLEFQANT